MIQGEIVAKSAGSFWPKTLEGWLGIIAILGAWAVIAWKGWQNILSKVNGVGERVQKLELASVNKESRLSVVEQFSRDSLKEFGDLRERIAKMEKANEHTQDMLTEMKLEILSAIHDNQRVMLERDAVLRERITRVETVADIEKKTGKPIPTNNQE